ncbi:hypothetical protein FA13DRAFT_1474374 [Coprinellus micaceus]|uniref:Uncharacterized protein n=1 Tax=Coprinellus micaceus TaxID=71717 RepID=A0A4Y7SN43_COPMI|nr:hypothetical protein FA13DRAFT_1474374 [Coprinellus micaceus]
MEVLGRMGSAQLRHNPSNRAYRPESSSGHLTCPPPGRASKSGTQCSSPSPSQVTPTFVEPARGHRSKACLKSPSLLRKFGCHQPRPARTSTSTSRFALAPRGHRQAYGLANSIAPCRVHPLQPLFPFDASEFPQTPSLLRRCRRLGFGLHDLVCLEHLASMGDGRLRWARLREEERGNRVGGLQWGAGPRARFR